MPPLYASGRAFELKNKSMTAKDICVRSLLYS